MAKIYGFELKAVKKTYGMEGEGFIANLYMDNKKVGSVADYGDGGCIDVSFESQREEVFKRALLYAQNHRKADAITSELKSPEEYVCLRDEGKLPLCKVDLDDKWSHIEHLVYELYEFLGLEKEFKKAIKKGWNAIVLAEYVYIPDTPLPLDQIYSTDGSNSDFQYVKDLAEEKSKAVELTQYSSLDDFIIPLP